MKLTVFTVLVCAFQLSANVMLAQKVNLKLGEASVREVFKELKVQTGTYFMYNEEDIAPGLTVKVDLKNVSLEQALEEICRQASLKYELVEDYVLVKKQEKPIGDSKETEQQQKKVVRGKVTNESGEALPGVTVLIKGTNTGVATRNDGTYTIEIKDDNTTLVFSFVGMETKEVSYTGQALLNVTLATDVESIEEVFITGYQKVSLERSTGSMETVKAEAIEKKGQSNLVNALEGMIAGLSVTADPDAEGGKKIDIRGVATINGNSDPLIIIDGFPVNTDISLINPYDVESVTVLKDAGAASIYGARAANGVIVITTKKGKKGNVKVNYSNNFSFGQRPDIDYRLNRTSSSDLVDAQMIGAESEQAYAYHTYEWFLENSPRFAYPSAATAVFKAMANANDGVITEAERDAIINPLRGIDNTSQIRDHFTQKPFEQQHNVSMSGGGENNVFRATINYTSAKTSFVGDDSERIIFDFQNSTDLTDKVRLDINGNFTSNTRESLPYNRDIVLTQVSSYELFEDANGNALPVTVGDVGAYRAISSGGLFGGKDPIEIQRLIDMGLYDETYYPLDELYNYNQTNGSFDARLQAMLYADLAKGLKGTFGFKYQAGANKNAKIAKAESFEMKSLVNNLSPVDYNGDNTTLNIPRGGRIIENRGDFHSYTGRAQLDYETSIKDHNFRALAGTEFRHIFSSYSSKDEFGYDDFSLRTIPVNKYTLGTQGTVRDINHPNGMLGGGISFADDIYEKTDRYFSGYGNFSYDYDQKYVLTGSMRIDQSNLFGTDPEYRYKPFWSVGGKWNMHEEDFFDIDFIDKLALRTSHGINGNIANLYGPFNIASSTLAYRAGNVEGLEITTPAIDNLRWERTVTTNIGLDMAMLKSRVRLGFDYYKKNTSDIFAFGKSDPVNGANSVLKNDANITNDGFELSLNTVNIRNEKFNWSTTLTLRRNKNKVKQVFNEEMYPIYLAQSPRNVEGYPVNSFFVFDWAGLDEAGNATIINHLGEVKTVEGYFSPYTDVVEEDLVYAGTTIPKFSGSFVNNLSYKGINLSFMFVSSLGHSMLKDTYNGEQIYSRPQNVNADAQFAWKEPGDEAFTDIPAISKSSSALYTSTFSKYSTKNVIDAGYVRLRELILSYSLPQKAIQVLPIESASVNFRGNNLWLWTKNDDGIDPEAHGYGRRYFPVQASYSFGINVGF